MNITEEPLQKFMVALNNNIELCWNEEDYLRANIYAEQMRQGDIFPPITVFGGIVHDGFHRLYAYRKLKRRTIKVIDLKAQWDPYDDETLQSSTNDSTH